MSRAVELDAEGASPVAAKIETFSSTAAFRVTDGIRAKRCLSRLHFRDRHIRDRSAAIRRDKNEIVVGSLTCQGDFGFRTREIARNVKIARPDILFFTGDQLYEANGGYGIQRKPTRGGSTRLSAQVVHVRMGVGRVHAQHAVHLPARRS